MFICKKQNCEDRGESPLYCAQCAKTKHDHRSVMISNELQDEQMKWNSLNINIIVLYHKVTEVYNSLEPLIFYLESSMMQPNV
jgi:hypothetical protein